MRMFEEWMPKLQVSRMLALTLLGCLTLILSGTAWAQARVVVVGGESAHHRVVFAAMRQALERGRSGTEVMYRTVAQYQTEPLARPELLVAIGTAAAEVLTALPREAPLLCVLLPRADYAALPQSEAVGAGALFIDQPVRRYLMLARLSLPQHRTVGAVLGPVSSALEEELRSEGQRLRLDTHIATIAEGQELAGALEQLTQTTDIALALPDPVVVNADTASTLILDAYHRGVPLIGYSQALAKAGALMALHTTPEQVGQEAGEMVRAALAATPVRLPPPRYPSYYSIAVNYQVARALGLELPAEEQLLRELRRQETAR